MALNGNLITKKIIKPIIMQDEILWLLIGAAAIISIMMIVAVLRIPQIARYHKATMKLTALMAKRQGVELESIRQTVRQADENIFQDRFFEQQIDG